MVPDWIWHGLVTNLGSEFIIFGGGLLLTILRVKKPNIAVPVLYGVATIALLSIIVFVFTGRFIFSTEQPQTNTENVESNIRTWLDDFGLTVQKQDIQNSYFTLLVTMHGGDHVFILRPKDHDRFIGFQGNVQAAPEHVAIINKLSKKDADLLVDEVGLELSRSKISYSIGGEPFKIVTIQRLVPITASLTESSFIQYLDETESGMNLVIASVNLALAGRQPQGLIDFPNAERK